MIFYSLFHSLFYFSFYLYILIHKNEKIGDLSKWSSYTLVSISGVIVLFLFMLIYYQLYFISQDITTSEYLRMDKYKKNFFDNGFKLNWKKFLNDENNYEKELVYNDDAKRVIFKTYLAKDFYNSLNFIKDLENKNSINITHNSDNLNGSLEVKEKLCEDNSDNLNETRDSIIDNIKTNIKI